MSPTIRTLLTSFVIAAVAPIGLAALDLETPAYAKNGGGNGGGNSNAGGNGKGGGKSSEAGQNKGSQAKANGKTKTFDTELTEDEDESLRPSALGKLNGVLNASPTAIANANANSPIGTAREFGEALADFLDGLSGEEPTGDEAATTEEDTDVVDIDTLGEMMANMTNKPVTAEQVEAVAARFDIETEEETTDEDAPTGDEATGDETASDEPTDEPSDEADAPTLDPETAQAIADKANEIHGFDTADDGDDAAADGDDTADTGDDAADAGDGAEETVTN